MTLVQTKFTTGTSVTGSVQGIIGRNTLSGVNAFVIGTTGKIKYRQNALETDSLSQHIYETIVDYVLQPNTTYSAIAVYDNYTTTVTLYDSIGTVLGTATTQIDNGYTKFSPFNIIRIGELVNLVFTGSVDLTSTKIYINDILMFRGFPAMTKTCSVVGCAGTAYLTADDKAIATGKGWELVVA